MGPVAGLGARLSGIGAGMSLMARIGAVAGCCLALAHCGKISGKVDPKYGVSASPRVVQFGEPVPKGGGVYRVGKPYVVGGRSYTPEQSAHYSAEGIASWYGEDFHGRLTANSEVYDMAAISAAHPTLPIPSYVRVTNLANKRSIVARVNDRGPYHQNRLIDVSVRTAKLLGFYDQGTARVRVDYVGPASLEGSDDSRLEATLRRGTPAPGPSELQVASSRSPLPRLFDPKPPAREAALVSPVEAMARGERELAARLHQRRDLWLALALAVGGAACALAPETGGMPLFGYAAALLLVGASAFAMPALVHGLTGLTGGILRKLLGVEAMLAARSMNGSLRRTAVLVGALSTAIAMMASVGIMVGSFRETVRLWMENQLQADFYLRPAGATAAGQHPTLAADLPQRIENVPGVAFVDRFRAYDISYQGLPATLAGADMRAAGGYRRLTFLSGRPAPDVYAQLLDTDAAIVSEPFAHKHHLRAGDRVTLPLGGAQRSFGVVDVYYDYSTEAGYILLDRATLLKYLPDPAPSNLAVYLAPGAAPEAVRTGIEQVTAGRSVLIAANRNLREQAIRVFDRTFLVTYALEAVSVLVAVIGIAGALLALVVDRRREFGVLRFLGASTQQIRKWILVEAGLIGLLANVAGLLLGLALSLILIYVINKQSFGWTIQFHWPVAVLTSSLTLVYLATLAAGLYPARIAARLNPIEVIHEE